MRTPSILEPRARGLASLLVLAFGAAPLGCHDHDHDHDHGPRDAGADDLARAACAARAVAATPVMASAGTLDAPRLSAGATPYRVALPAGGTGFVRLAVPHQHYDWALFASAGVTAVQQGGTRIAGAPAPSVVCPAEIAHELRIHLHSEIDLLVTLQGDAAAPIWVLWSGSASDHHAPGDAAIDADPSDAHAQPDAHATDAPVLDGGADAPTGTGPDALGDAAAGSDAASD